jgi:tetratricopeptide (TPR) repeat protein
MRAHYFMSAALLLTPAVAGAQDDPPSLEEATSVANQLDSDIAIMKTDVDTVRTGYGITRGPKVGRVERRLREAEIHYLLGDFLRASIVLLDVVEDDVSKGHARYPDCVFLLAESLRKSKNYSGARTYYEEILPRSTGDRLKDIVLGLLQIASDTNRYEEVDRYIAALRQAGTLSRPDVDYIYGKMLFRSAGDDASKQMRAYEQFRSVPAGAQVSGPAAYYAGVSLVKMGRYQEALKQFDETLVRIGGSAEHLTLRELTHLSLGRLYQELGDVGKSADAYQEISQTSVYFGDMLYEVAWAHVTAANQTQDPEEQRKSYTRALQATELLMATAPTSRLFPQASILQGNLQIRLGAPETAYDTFQGIVDRYGGARDKLLEMIDRSNDPKAFFDQLVSDDLARIAPQDLLPKVALNWALEEEELERAVAMEQDLADSKKYLAESRELVDTLEEALRGEQRFNMFPGLRSARSKALSVENRAIDGHRRLIRLERDIVYPAISASERAAIEAAHTRATQLEVQIEQLPKSSEAVDANRDVLKDAYLGAGRQAHKLTYRLSSMRAQLVAIELWLRDNRSKLNADEIQRTEGQLEEGRTQLIAMEQELDGLETEIRKAADLIEGDGGRTGLDALKGQFAQAQAEEQALLRSHRGRAQGELQGVLARIDQQRVALTSITDDLRQLQGSLEENVKDEVAQLRRGIAEEVAKLERYNGEHSGLTGESDRLVGPVATRSLSSVGEQFKNLVLKADVGIIDVAWARKQAETDKVNAMLKQAQDRATELETDFADVLKE